MGTYRNIQLITEIFSDYYFSSDSKIQATYLPKTDKILVLMFQATQEDWDSHNFYAKPYTYDLETNTGQ